MNIMEAAQAMGASTLVDYLAQAGLDEILVGEGPFTLFAPTDAAFLKLTEPMHLMLQTSIYTLRDILKYFIVADNITTSRLTNDQLIETIEGAKIRINVYDQVSIAAAVEAAQFTDGPRNPFSSMMNAQNNQNNQASQLPAPQLADVELAKVIGNASVTNDPDFVAVTGLPLTSSTHPAHRPKGSLTTIITATGQRVIRPDVMASNGVLHLVDGVLRVPTGSAMDYVSQNTDLLTMRTNLLKPPGFEPGLSTAGPFTVFVPNNEAFQAENRNILDTLLNDPGTCQALLGYHVLAGTYFTAGFMNRQRISVYDQTDSVQIRVDGEHGFRVNNATILTSDITVLNGVIHIIDAVLVPPALLESIHSGAYRSMGVSASLYTLCGLLLLQYLQIFG